MFDPSPKPTLREDLVEMGFDATHNPTPDELKKQWRKVGFENHPDRNPGDPEVEAKFKRANNAKDRLTTAMENIEAGREQAEQALQRHFDTHSANGGWVDNHLYSGEHVSSFPIDHMADAEKASLREALQAQGFKVEERFSRTMGGNVISVTSDPRNPVKGSAIHGALEEHFDPALKAEREAARAAAAAKAPPVPSAPKAKAPAAEPPPVKGAPRGAAASGARAAENAAVHEAEHAMGGVAGKAAGNVERQMVNAASHSGGKWGTYLAVGAAAVAGLALAASYFRKSPKDEKAVPPQARQQQNPYDFGGYPGNDSGQSWVQRVQNQQAQSMGMER